jgi:hypothetical protein
LVELRVVGDFAYGSFFIEFVVRSRRGFVSPVLDPRASENPGRGVGLNEIALPWCRKFEKKRRKIET